MYAVIVSGGKQYRVAEGDRIKLEKLDTEVGKKVDFEKVLMLADGDKIEVGKPYLEGKKVSGTVTEHGRGKKISIIKMRRRKNSRRQAGHRQHYTEVEIGPIGAKKRAAAKTKKAEAAEE